MQRSIQCRGNKKMRNTFYADSVNGSQRLADHKTRLKFINPFLYLQVSRFRIEVICPDHNHNLTGRITAGSEIRVQDRGDTAVSPTSHTMYI